MIDLIFRIYDFFCNLVLCRLIYAAANGRLMGVLGERRPFSAVFDHQLIITNTGGNVKIIFL